jgi:guanosine-3',5'-bis(diphosphate) 3'-pyrophosphohydrolase
MTSMPPIPSPSYLLVVRALAYAAARHENQRRKNAKGTPYINHPIALLEILVTCGVTDGIVLAAALLHDTIEDTGATAEELTAQFGAEVAAIVVEVSDDKSLPKAERKRLQIEHAASASPRAKLVKLADKIANLRDMVTDPPAYWPLERRLAYFDWAAAVLEGLRGTHAQLERAFEIALQGRSQL